MKTLFVLGTWSSGSTALTGYLERLGAYTCPPHIQTFDERTPNSHESLEFRNLLASFRDEISLQTIRPIEQFQPLLTAWHAEKMAEAQAAGASVIALKHPLSAFFVPQLAALPGASFIVITRPFRDIERTRQRRQWHAVYGAEGAGRVYSALMSGLIEAQESHYTIAFRAFLDSAEERKKLRENLPNPLNEGEIVAAESWLRR